MNDDRIVIQMKWVWSICHPEVSC